MKMAGNNTFHWLNGFNQLESINEQVNDIIKVSSQNRVKGQLFSKEFGSKINALLLRR